MLSPGLHYTFIYYSQVILIISVKHTSFPSAVDFATLIVWQSWVSYLMPYHKADHDLITTRAIEECSSTNTYAVTSLLHNFPYTSILLFSQLKLFFQKVKRGYSN